jgi:hypothetical protein
MSKDINTPGGDGFAREICWQIKRSHPASRMALLDDRRESEKNVSIDKVVIAPEALIGATSCTAEKIVHSGISVFSGSILGI